ncbi:GtrA family protein [Thalassococcus sp. CAU 1522]|uniref:GtrA family protein n=1 Tax=Thalassococcus arenae TaxID=2851652 RepID=A0ABS6N7K9_9RHOB|nr:GtrA family protein [Thalassococcus arenae]MBV2360001.1 GtrA family protein [Thalassococcus arenae]
MSVRGGKIGRFALVGVAVALAYVALYVLFLGAGLGRPWANGLAFGLAIALQYAGQGAFTFGRRLRDGAQMLRFGVMVGLGFATSLLVTSGIGPAIGLADWMAAAAVTGILPVQNFVIMTLWVFASPIERMDGLS